MRVLVYGLVGNHLGGIETFLLKMNSNMSKDTIFDYVIEEEICLHEEEITNKNGHIYHVCSRRANPFKNIKDNNELLETLRDQIEAVYFNLSSLSWIEPIALAVNKGYRVYVHSHNAEFIKANNNLPYRIVNKINKLRLHKLNVIRLTCSKLSTKFMFFKDDNVTMIYNAIQVDRFKYDIKNREIQRRKLGINGKTTVLGFVGRLEYQKNPLYLPIILDNLIKKQLNIMMVVIGDGELKVPLIDSIKEKHLENHVIFLGNITNVNELMSAMDVLVLPSYHEGLPYVMIEAQTAGLPCFVADTITDEAKITDIVKYLPLSVDAKEWSESILDFINSQRIDRSCYSKIVSGSNFDINVEASVLEDILRSE